MREERRTAQLKEKNLTEPMLKELVAELTRDEKLIKMELKK